MRVGGAAAACGAVYLESGVTRRPPQQPGEGAGVGGGGCCPCGVWLVRLRLLLSFSLASFHVSVCSRFRDILNSYIP